MNYKEIEFKYNADDIPLSAFNKFCKALGGGTFLLPSGYDHFYQNTGDKNSFGRHRVGPDMNQLTFKRKTTVNNNFIRTEHNIDLDKKVNREQVAALFGEFGYQYKTSIFKDSFIYVFDKYNFVYYICYDLEMDELGRFIEIEMAEDHPWESEDQAYGELKTLEGLGSEIGLSPNKRIKKSLFEMFAEDKK